MNTPSKTGKEEAQAIAQPVQNPFENNQPVEKDIAQSEEELEKEQQYKQAQTERD